MAQHQVSVTDVVAPTAKISFGRRTAVDDGTVYPEAVLRSCASSTDDHRVDVWQGHRRCTQRSKHHLGGVLGGLGEHTVRLTVTDLSGNTDVLNAVWWSSTELRLFSATSASALPASVEGVSTVVRVMTTRWMPPTRFACIGTSTRFLIRPQRAGRRC